MTEIEDPIAEDINRKEYFDNTINPFLDSLSNGEKIYAHFFIVGYSKFLYSEERTDELLKGLKHYYGDEREDSPENNVKRS